jgi:hypothetical protein
MVQWLGKTGEPAKLHSSRRPAGNIIGQYLQERKSTLAPPVVYCVGYFAARYEDFVSKASLWRDSWTGFSSFMDLSISHQIAYVRNYPILTRLYEPVLVKLIDITLYQIDLLGYHF